MMGKPTFPASAKFQSTARKAYKLLELADTYLNDGAFNTAAENYEKGAALLREAAAIRNAALGGK